MAGSRVARLLAALATAAAALMLAACAPAAPVRQALTGDATSTAPVIQPSPTPPVPTATPAPPPAVPRPTPVLESGPIRCVGYPLVRYPRRTMDELLSEVNALVPGFGGMYEDPQQGVLFVYLRDPTELDAARAAIENVIGRDKIPRGGVRVLPGAYAWDQLRSWRNCLEPHLYALGVLSGSDLDEGANRISYDVIDEPGVAKVEEVLARSDVPRQAVIIRIGRVVPLSHQTLQSEVRPLVASLQIRRSPAGTECTLGFNAVRSRTSGFVTAAHCTANRFYVDGDVFYQEEPPKQVGVESVDPSWWTGSPCPSGRVCRWSDTAFVTRDATASGRLGVVAKTLGEGSLVIKDTESFRITAEGLPSLGNSVVKMGRTTGWTSGQVRETCKDVPLPAPSLVTFLCQDLADNLAQGGDSGSPVFIITNSLAPDDVTLLGLLWGLHTATGWMIFSAIGQIQFPEELGTLNAFGPLAHWALDEGGGITAYDSSGAGFHGTLVNGPQWFTPGRVGLYALSFDGVDDYVTVADSPSLTFGDGSTDRAFSIALWARPDVITGKVNGLLSKALEYNQGEYALLLEWSRVTFRVIDDSARGTLARNADGAVPTLGLWYHIVGTYDGSRTADGIKIYVNGALVNSANASGGAYVAMEDTSYSVSIGDYWPTDPDRFDGLLDEVRVYDKALTAGEVWDLCTNP